ncbi:DUF6233 domain-containing protein [Streptomyces bobili]|uniref:DUF6233 domain-containing protein n=1 Tax=Streptomyces bobili TaxID=67280 RepID=UPI003724B968
MTGPIPRQRTPYRFAAMAVQCTWCRTQPGRLCTNQRQTEDRRKDVHGATGSTTDGGDGRQSGAIGSIIECMSELPEDAPRLRAILAHLDKQVADTETVGIYLQLQRQAVQDALARAEAPPPRRRGGPRVKGATGLPAMAQTHARPAFVVQHKRTSAGPEPAQIHLADCTMIEGTPHPIRDHDARGALAEPTIEPCAFCRPDTELGIDVA